MVSARASRRRPPRVRGVTTAAAPCILGDEGVTVSGDQAAAVVKELEVVGHHGAERFWITPLHEHLEQPGVRRDDLRSQVFAGRPQSGECRLPSAQAR